MKRPTQRPRSIVKNCSQYDVAVCGMLRVHERQALGNGLHADSCYQRVQAWKVYESSHGAVCKTNE